MDELCLEWSRLMDIPINNIIPNDECCNDPGIIFNLIPVDEMIDFVLNQDTREDFRDWMPCRVSMIGVLMRCRYININPRSPSYHHTLYMNIDMDNNGFRSKLQEFDGSEEISCTNVQIP